MASNAKPMTTDSRMRRAPESGPQDSLKMSQASHPSTFLARLRSREAFTGELLGQLNDWLDHELSGAQPLEGGGEPALNLAMAIVDNTDESILRQKALLLMSRILQVPSAAPDLQNLRQTIRPILMDAKANLWELVGALLVSHRIEPADVAASFLASVFEASHAREDGFFLRANIMEHAKDSGVLFDGLSVHLPALLFDPSAYVRIRGLELLRARGDSIQLLHRCRQGDHDPQVQVPLFHVLADMMFDCDASLLGEIRTTFETHSAAFDPQARLSFILQVNACLLKALQQGQALSAPLLDTLRAILKTIRADEQDGLRRQSSFTLRCVDLLAQEKTRRTFLRVQDALFKGRSSGSVVLPVEDSRNEMPSILSVLAFSGSGYEVMPNPSGLHIRPAYHYSFSLWRFVHELLRPSGNKRQGASHWRSRDLQGTIRVPSSVTCELVETSVPGEALYIPEASGWRPWLPLLCDVYRMIFRFPLLEIWTPDGLTTVERPASWRQRWSAWGALVWRFESVSRLRNWTTRQGGDPAGYIQSLRKLGFRIRFEAGPDGEAQDRTVMQFFGRDA